MTGKVGSEVDNKMNQEKTEHPFKADRHLMIIHLGTGPFK
jgi:hypothetical protein